MKKVIFFACLFSSQFIIAQGYLKLGGGYGFSASKDNFSSPVLVLQGNNSIASKENIYGTIGSGATVRLAGGYTFSNNFGIELEAYYLMGDKKYVTEFSNSSTNLNEKSFAYTRQFRVLPSLYVKASKGLLKPYIGFGPLLPLAGYTYLEVKRQDPAAQTNSFYVRKVSGNFSIGFESYAGANISWPNENFNLFIELRYTGLRIKSKFAETIQYDITNTATGEVTDNLSSLTTFQREINFVDKLTPESNAFEGPGGINAVAFDSTKPMDKLSSTNNFNAFGINLGVRVNLVSKKASE
jgi:hypothetical protein